MNLLAAAVTLATIGALLSVVTVTGVWVSVLALAGMCVLAALVSYAVEDRRGPK